MMTESQSKTDDSETKLISLKYSREHLISQLKENSCPWKGREAGSEKELLPTMSSSHCTKYESVQEPNREVLSAEKLAQLPLKHSVHIPK